MATYKATAAADGASAKYLHEGTVSVKSTYTWTATASVGDVVQMVKVPYGAIIDDIVVYATGGDHADIGDGGSVNRFKDSASALTTMHSLRIHGVGTTVGYQYSASSAVSPRYDTIDLTILVADSSPTDVTTMVVSYHCDQSGGG